MSPGVRARTLQRAVEIAGGREKLCELLGVPLASLEDWLTGGEPLPTDIFLEAVDIIAGWPSPDVLRSRVARHNARATVRKSVVALARAQATLEAILSGQRGRAPARRKQPTALDFLQARFHPDDGAGMVEAAVGAAVGSTDAAAGNLQIMRPDGLAIAAQQGFEAPFLEFFARVADAGSACGAALQRAQRVIVPDVAKDPIFAGTRAGEVMLEANALAVQSTPLVAPSGEVLGMLSTHYDRVCVPSERELDLLNHIARRTAFWLDGGAL
jgi:DNA-binding transcriptional regulator YdaS (Cro superfamily)